MTIFLSLLWAVSLFLIIFSSVSYLLIKRTAYANYSRSALPYKNNSLGNLFKAITQHRLFQPGWFLQKFDNPKRNTEVLNQSGLIDHLSLLQYQSLKQLLITAISWYVLIYILIWGSFVKMITFEIIVIICIIHLPDIVLRFIANRRGKHVDTELTNFIDMLTMSIESGMNFINAFEFVGRRSKGILGAEAKRVIQKIQFGFSLEESFELFSKRLASNDLKHLTQAVKQAKQLGVSIAETLRIQAQLIRNRRRQRAEELSKTAAVKIAIPLVFFIFPALLIIYIGPAILRLLQN